MAVSLQQMADKWQEKVSNKGSKWKDHVENKGDEYCGGLTAIQGIDRCVLGDEYNRGVARVSASEFNEAVRGKASKFRSNFQDAIEGK